MQSAHIRAHAIDAACILCWCAYMTRPSLACQKLASREPIRRVRPVPFQNTHIPLLPSTRRSSSETHNSSGLTQHWPLGRCIASCRHCATAGTANLLHGFKQKHHREVIGGGHFRCPTSRRVVSCHNHHRLAGRLVMSARDRFLSAELALITGQSQRRTNITHNNRANKMESFQIATCEPHFWSSHPFGRHTLRRSLQDTYKRIYHSL
jgi:hypothetical protein